MSISSRAVLLFALVQGGWFACVFGAAHGYSWLGPGVVFVGLAIHVGTQPGAKRAKEVLVLALAAVLGFLMDSALLRAGVMTVGCADVSPPWLVALWPNLAAATARGGGLGSLERRPIVQVLLGVLGGPLAYDAGARLDAIALAQSRLGALVIVGGAWSFVLPTFFWLRRRLGVPLGDGGGARRVGRVTIAAGLLVATSFIAVVGRADAITANGAGDRSADSGASVIDLRARYAGSYRYAGSAAEQKMRAEAIDRSVETFFFVVRGMARARLTDRTRIMPTCKFEFGGGNIRSTVPGHAVAVSPENGAPAPYRVDDDAIVLSQRFEGQRLVQVFRADEGGTRTNEFTLSPDGTLLVMKATLSSPKLSIPVIYTLTYRRIES